MARIRTIKPEFWNSPGIETLDARWRLLYIAMWNWADDSGAGKAEARELMGFAFPRDEQMTLGEFRRGLGEVRRVFGVVFYQVDGRSYYSIPTWVKHQKIDKRSASRWPEPSEGVEVDPETNEQVTGTIEDSHRESAESPPSTRSDSGAGTGEQGNRGTGDKEHVVPAAQAPSVNSKYRESFEEFWNAYPRKTDKGGAAKAFDKARKRTSERTLIAAAARLAADPNLPEAQYIPHATTWLNGSRWDDGPLPPRSDGRRRNADDTARELFAMADRIGQSAHLKAVEG